jgi:hypothetical protein
MLLVDESQNAASRVIVDIAVDNRVLFAAFEHSRQGEHRQGKAAIARLGGAWIE